MYGSRSNPRSTTPTKRAATAPAYARDPQYHDLLRVLPSLARYRRLISDQLVERRLADKRFAPGQCQSDREDWARTFVNQVLDDLATLETVK